MLCFLPDVEWTAGDLFCVLTGVPRLFDLVRVKDKKLEVAFYYAMRETVVANDLDQASKIAYGADKRWKRVVTLKVRSARTLLGIWPPTCKHLAL